MAELSSPQSLPPKSEPDNLASQPDPQPESAPPATQLSAPPPPPPALNPSSNANPPPIPLPTPVPLYAQPPVSGAAPAVQPPVPMFRPGMPQFSPIPGAVTYQNPSVTSAPGMAPGAVNAPVHGTMMQYQMPIPGQPPNPAMRPFVPMPNGYAAMPPPGLPGYHAPYTAMARPIFHPRPPGAVGVLPAILRPPIPLVPGVRPILPPIVRPGLVPVTPAEKPQTTVYVGKIAPSVSNDFMLSLLQLCGPVKSWKRVQDPTDGTLKRFGLCEFESAEGVLRALRLLDKLNLDGQELGLKFNEATKGYLLRYIEKKTENAKKLKENEATVAEKEGQAPAATENSESPNTRVDESKKDDSDLGKGNESSLVKADDSDSGKKDDTDPGKKDADYSTFGLVTDEDREADKEVSDKISSMIEERLKTLPPPPPLTDGLASTGSEIPEKSRDKDSDADLIKNASEDKHDEETTSDNKTTSEHDKTETSSPDRSRRYDRRNRDRDRDLKRDKEREIERYEREAERERIRKEREQRRKIEDAEREYEERLKDWEYREREKDKQRQYDREREKERERKRKKEIIYDEEDGEEDSRRRWHRSVLEEKRKKRSREKEDDLADRTKEAEEIVEAKKKDEEDEKLRQLQCETVEPVSDNVPNGSEKHGGIEIATGESKDRTALQHSYGDSVYTSHADEVTSEIGNVDSSTFTTAVASDMQNSNVPAKKLGFGLSGSGKRTAVPSVFHEDDDDDAHKDKKMRPLVPIDYSTEEMEAIQPAPAGVPQPNLAAAAEYAKRISTVHVKEEKHDLDRERSRRPHDRSSQRDRDRYDEDGSRVKDENKEKNLDRDRDRENGSDKSKTPENKKLLDAKQLIDMIPKTKEDLFSYEINWALYDKHELHERMRPWISKKITEFLGEEEKSLVDYIVSSTQEHVKAAEMLETLKSILDEEAEMFVLKMWRMLIFEIKRVETGLHLRSKT